jgi:hypothetical protein
MEVATNAYTEIIITGKPEDIAYCVSWLGEVYSGDLRFAEDALSAIAMDAPEFIPFWSGVEPVEAGTKIWIVNLAGISELAIVSLHEYLFDEKKVFAEIKCLRAADGAFGEYILEGDKLHSLFVSAEDDGQEIFETKAEEMFGKDWRQLADTSYCYSRLEKEAENYEEG